jgi:hypothetical protein
MMFRNACIILLRLTLLFAGAGLALEIRAQEPGPDVTDTRLTQILEQLEHAEGRLSTMVIKDFTELYILDKRHGATTGRENSRLLTGAAHPLLALRLGYGDTIDYLPLKQILSGSRLTPVRTDERAGRLTDVLSFTREEASGSEGSMQERIARSLEGSIWVDRDSGAVVRMDFRNCRPILLAGGLFGRVSSIRGYIEFQRVQENVWMPRHEEVMVEGHEAIVSGIALRLSNSYELGEVSDFTEVSAARRRLSIEGSSHVAFIFGGIPSADSLIE